MDAEGIKRNFDKACVEMMICASNTKTQADLIAVYVTLYSSLAQTIRLRCDELGWDIDSIRSHVDAYFLVHPELQ